ncbi:MAG: hypothetical protein KZQ83_15935 [gamma proteobacterium symbiont of Taylorina sp.]|nr:hypothetical protein [gamma proteobacterium symbiont of Taylorina sp.]
MSNQLKTAAVIGGDILLYPDKPRFISPDNAQQLAESLRQSAYAAEQSKAPILEECKAKRVDKCYQQCNKELVENFPQVRGNPANDIVPTGEQLQGKPANDIPLNSEELDRQLPPILEEVPSKQTLQDELKLISDYQEIAGITENNNHYTPSLTLHINKSVESLTVAQ